MTSWYGKDFDRVVQWAKKIAPFQFRTVKTLRDVDGEESLGMSSFKDGKWRIEIVRGLDIEQANEIILHELAHVIQGNGCGPKMNHDDDHNAMWGRLYAMIWREFHKARDNGELYGDR